MNYIEELGIGPFEVYATQEIPEKEQPLYGHEQKIIIKKGGEILKIDKECRVFNGFWFELAKWKI